MSATPHDQGSTAGATGSTYSGLTWSAFAKAHGLRLRNSYYLPNPVIGILENRPFTLLAVRTGRSAPYSVMSLALSEEVPLDLRVSRNDSSAAVSLAKRALGLKLTIGDPAFDEAVTVQARNVDRAKRYLNPERRAVIRKALDEERLVLHSGEIHIRLDGIPTQLALLDRHLSTLLKWAAAVDAASGQPPEFRAAS